MEQACLPLLLAGRLTSLTSCSMLGHLCVPRSIASQSQGHLLHLQLFFPVLLRSSPGEHFQPNICSRFFWAVVRARDSALYIRMLGPSTAADSLRSTVSPDSWPALQMPLWLFCELLPCSPPPCHPPTFYRVCHLGATNLHLEILATSRIFKMRKVGVG